MGTGYHLSSRMFRDFFHRYGQPRIPKARRHHFISVVPARPNPFQNIIQWLEAFDAVSEYVNCPVVFGG
jgi:hypothetical protein